MTDVVIAGAGVTGLIAAVRCARAGHRVTVVDRGPIPNPASSSFDHHRAVRALSPGDPAATAAAAALHRRWLRLQALLGGPFYRRIGVVTGWPAASIDFAVAEARRIGLPVRVVEPKSLPHIVFPSDHYGLLEADAGVLLAERVLHAAARWLRAQPAVTLLPWRQVVEVDTDAARLRLRDGARIGGDLVLLATGAWTGELVDVPTVLHRQTTVYLRPPADLAAWWEQAPSAGRIGADGTGWLMPPGAGTLLKLSSSRLCRTVEAVGTDAESLHAARDHVDHVLADAHRYRIAAVKQCHYTVDAATGGATLARPGPAVLARAATGGDGFRTAPLVADHLVELAAARPAA
ncbi:NAD(P)/FAD-dependent oxidoreductase [Nocardia bhagyanarayanae]|uniref:Glycine/D-amino acid oxidase-like deaminating enzyme n=1 Tax=Nocardia bhagyanarayanae TaxID=1215925 RepID=A0A543FD18_9NOCA|nr:FAD-binding oxidoreductase [Nocardia bhagyanarayanae]TQM31789.1 glycine/D-amino acid oxidase-like deaminating enzyme [Nocardia bhagyanarayanae]